MEVKKIVDGKGVKDAKCGKEENVGTGNDEKKVIP